MGSDEDTAAAIEAARRGEQAVRANVREGTQGVSAHVLEMYKRLTEGANDDEERRRRIEAFASAMAAGQQVQRAPAPAQYVPEPRTSIPQNLRPSDAVTESVPAAGYETPIQTAMIVPQGATRYDSITNDPRFREQRR